MTLTVLAYHRIADPAAAGFRGFRPNVSATPAAFAAQLDYLAARFTPVTVAHVVRWLDGGEPLPKRALLVTFDDGYRDNLDVAWPALSARRIPAVIFLATDHIGSSRPFYWDLAAEAFRGTSASRAVLPELGERAWSGEAERDRVLDEWIAAAKALPEARRREAARQLTEALAVAVPDERFTGMHLDWDEVRRMRAEGVEFGGHTKSHPILTRLPPDQALGEIAGSVRRVEQETGAPVLSFAYPNGCTGDWSSAAESALTDLGVRTAFTLEPGPSTLAEVRRHPLAIRRVFLSYKDSPTRFAAKVRGLARLAHAIR